MRLTRFDLHLFLCNNEAIEVVHVLQVCQRLMVQGIPGTTVCNGPFDVVRKVTRAEGFRGLYRGFGLTATTQTPASALWWGAYGSAQHMIWRWDLIH